MVYGPLLPLFHYYIIPFILFTFALNRYFSTMNILIRQAKPFDAEIITGFQIRMAKETENLDLNPLIVQKGVQAVFKNPELGTYYVAEDHEEMVASLLVTPEWSDWRNARVLWIQSVYVKPECRKKGVYKQMYLWLKEKILNSPEFIGLRLYVDKTNLSAREVYKTLGMNSEHYELFEWLKPVN